MKIDPSIQLTFTFAGRVVVTPDNLKIGAKVTHGPDWMWGDQGKGLEGVIDRILPTNGWVMVEWPNNTNYGYRIGAQDSYDLTYI